MGTKKITAELRLSHWAQVLRERSESGLSVRRFCIRSGIHENTYFYWQKKLRETVGSQLLDLHNNPVQCGQTSFAEVRIPETLSAVAMSGSANRDGGIQVEINGARISADSAYPADKLAM